MIREFVRGLSAVTLVMCATATVAQDFPKREVTLLVNYGAGCNTDVASRALAHLLLGKNELRITFPVCHMLSSCQSV